MASFLRAWKVFERLASERAEQQRQAERTAEATLKPKISGTKLRGSTA